MIIPNLMVRDMAGSIAFYRDTLGMKPIMMIAADKQMISEGDGGEAVFTILEWDSHQIMLQTVASLSDELDVFKADTKPGLSGAIYFRGLNPDDFKDRIPAELIVKGPVLQWYGMKEIYIRDPDGYIICLGVPEGEAPA